jgi:nicotinic acetylcholine receptor alpha-6
MYLKILSVFLFFIGNAKSNEETNLRNSIFGSYNKDIRPTKSYNNTLEVRIGLAVQNIESFDQIHESIELNVWLRKYWRNEHLIWNTKLSNISQLTLNEKDVWTPDIELLNAATLPDIYTLNGGMYLYPNGEMLWSMPVVYKFSCPLQLKFFPFDKQTCTMKFASWSFDNSLVKLKPYGDKNTQIDVLDSFSHSEWDLKEYSIYSYNETRVCCPNKKFGVIEYNFELTRYTHYYVLNMGMTISLVIVSFIIMLVKADNLSRTGTAVFIPLTILALELTIAGKIPVVGYYTLMDIFFLTCFITSMTVSIESGIVYILITSKSGLL